MKQKPALYVQRRDRVSLLANKLICYLDRLFTACQKCLEGQDKPQVMLVEKVVLIASVLYFAAHVVLWIFRGG